MARFIVMNGLLIFLYVPLALCGLMLSIPPGNATPIYPAAGLAFAAYLIWGRSVLLGIGVAGAVANFVSIAFSTHLIPALACALCIGIGEVLAVIIAGKALSGFAPVRGVLKNSRNICVFFAISLAWFISPTVGISALWLTGFVADDAYLYTWVTWWLGDAAGIIMLTPLLLAVFRPPINQNTRMEHPVLFILCTVLALLLLIPISIAPWPIVYLAIPIALFFAFRFNLVGASLINFLISLIFVCSAALGYGAYSGYDMNQTLLFLQIYIVVVCFTSLIVTANINQIGTLKLKLSQAQQLSLTDPLTGIANRFALEQRLPFLLTNTRAQQQTLVLLLMDLKGLTLINENLGQPAGDRALILFTQALQGMLRKGDLLARVESDKFVWCVPNMTLDMADELVKRIHKTSQMLLVDGFALSCRIVSQIDQGRGDFKQLLSMAELKLERLKQQG